MCSIVFSKQRFVREPLVCCWRQLFKCDVVRFGTIAAILSRVVKVVIYVHLVLEPSLQYSILDHQRQVKSIYVIIYYVRCKQMSRSLYTVYLCTSVTLCGQYTRSKHVDIMSCLFIIITEDCNQKVGPKKIWLLSRPVWYCTFAYFFASLYWIWKRIIALHLSWFS